MNYYLQFILLVIVTIIPAYILGGLNGAIITTKLLYNKDIRDYGSGNAGVTNFYRTFGAAGALLVIIIDVIKTVVPVLVGGWLFRYYRDMMPSIGFPFGWLLETSFFGQALAGLAVMLGHCFPVFYRFKGGKGVMAIGCIVIIIDWRLALIAWTVFILTVAISRYISLGSILGSISFVLCMAIMGIGGLAELTVIFLCVLLVVIRHAENIRRIIKGEESGFTIKKKKAEE